MTLGVRSLGAGRPAEPPFRRLGIVGVGLIGGSIASAARAVWPNLTVVGVDRRSAADAHARGVIDETRASVADLSDVDLVVLAAPVDAILELLPEIAAARLDAVITDVGSTKREIVAAAQRLGLERFVGGHPVAGAERGGLDHANADLFAGRPWVLMTTPGREADVDRVHLFASGLGARVSTMDAMTHDRLMAYVSHVPQLLAVALMNAVGRAGGDAALGVSGRAFREMTRVAESPEDLWRGILASNADFVAEALDALIAELPRASSALSDGGWSQRSFPSASDWRSRLNAIIPPA